MTNRTTGLLLVIALLLGGILLYMWDSRTSAERTAWCEEHANLVSYVHGLALQNPGSTAGSTRDDACKWAYDNRDD